MVPATSTDLAGMPTPRVFPVKFVATAANLQLMAGPVVLMGYGVIESTGATKAEVDIINGRDTTADVVCPVSLTPGQSVREWFGPWGIELDTGLFLQLVAGTVRGAIYVALPQQVAP